MPDIIPEGPRQLRCVIARNARQRREELGLTQNEVMMRAGVSLSTLRALEDGSRNLRLDSVVKVAEALGITLMEILEE